MNILKVWHHKILFGYYLHPAEIWDEMEDAGFSVRLFADGTLIYQNYSLDIRQFPYLIQSGRVTLSEDSVGRITRILAGYAKEIDALPSSVNNGSYGGSFNDFVFCGKFVSSLNIRRTDLKEKQQEEEEYFEKYRFDMADENTVLDIFTRIIEVMRDDGVMLHLCHLQVNGESIY